ncbi:hypothetical protein FN846DRAFT_929129, partial [Sphaerosporella brunnea]
MPASRIRYAGKSRYCSASQTYSRCDPTTTVVSQRSVCIRLGAAVGGETRGYDPPNSRCGQMTLKTANCSAASAESGGRFCGAWPWQAEIGMRGRLRLRGWVWTRWARQLVDALGSRFRRLLSTCPIQATRQYCTLRSFGIKLSAVPGPCMRGEDHAISELTAESRSLGYALPLGAHSFPFASSCAFLDQAFFLRLGRVRFSSAIIRGCCNRRSECSPATHNAVL